MNSLFQEPVLSAGLSPVQAMLASAVQEESMILASWGFFSPINQPEGNAYQFRQRRHQQIPKKRYLLLPPSFERFHPLSISIHPLGFEGT